MKYEEGDYEATHSAPAWRDRANFIFAAYLGVKNERREWEQLWGHEVAPLRYILCCIPFFVNDLALGDEVETDDSYTLKRVVKSAGQVTFRIWFIRQTLEARQRMALEMEQMGAILEWSSENLLAVSISSLREQEMADYLISYELINLIKYDTGKSIIPETL